MAKTRTSTLSEAIGIIGTGVAGIISAHVLVEDGFQNVTLISRDSSAGGVWARERIYEGLRTNSVHGEYRFSAMKTHRREVHETDNRLTGTDICQYLEEYTDKFLQGKVKFVYQTEVIKVWRDKWGAWYVESRTLDNDRVDTYVFSRIILATGGTHSPNIPRTLDPSVAYNKGFKGRIFHSADYGKEEASLLIPEDSKDHPRPSCVVIGGGKSAQDISTYMARKGFHVTVVYEKLDVYFATTRPVPEHIRKSRQVLRERPTWSAIRTHEHLLFRFMSVISPHRNLNTKLERFLHTTRVGAGIVRNIWKSIAQGSVSACSVPKGSPLLLTPDAFWSLSNSDEGVPRPDGFHSLVNQGVIKVAAPARAIDYSSDGVILNNGEHIPADVVILATGYTSSWGVVDDKTAAEIGLIPHQRVSEFTDEWRYTTLRDPPAPHPERDDLITSIYRGIVPGKNILRRDFAILGAQYTINPPYTDEVAAHWISAYFQEDEMRLPLSAKEAIVEAERMVDYARVRYPQAAFWKHGSGGLTPDAWTWPQAADELLEDMFLQSHRSGGNSLTWLFKPVDADELAMLHDERRRFRGLEQPLLS